ncbi:MAG: nucleotide sugar dehydrogenase [Phycisphaerae bacterium]|nr:nucleotide sugar dehydrogenase [Phycisphaerae bacterium]MBT5383297.1 nucleotide sugar dehydrogenase [Phycisphaerae bacterium]MBT5657275.1 nucleotide sugar dehydrogenase [Phycisphaerae bacterium]
METSIVTPQATTIDNQLKTEVQQRIVNSTATVAIVGMGYVGFPLACAVNRAGYGVCGFDVDPSKIESLIAGRSYLGHLADDPFRELASAERFSATVNPADIKHCDIVVLCVPTPLGEDRTPDLSYVIQSTEMVAKVLKPGMLIVLESTTWPGTTRQVMLPILEAGGLTCGVDFFLAYSPERENPGDAVFETASIPKVVGGIDETACELACEFYKRVVCDVVAVSSVEIAEAAKIVENVYRCVNIALVNELKLAFEKMDIDVWEVIKASATKPFGFQAFWPGPGLGGHCIPIDPFYLSWRAKQCGGETQFIELAGEINTAMPSHVVDRVCFELGDATAGSRVMVIGVSYKPNVSDIRETPAAPIIEQLQARGCEVSYHDPHCPNFPAMKRHAIDLSSVPLDAAHLAAADAVLIVTNHDAIDWTIIGDHASLIVDTRNAMAGISVAGRLVKA